MTGGARAGHAAAALILVAIVSLSIALRPVLPWIADYPAEWTLPLPSWVGEGLIWFVALAKPVFRFIGAALAWPLTGLRDFLLWIPAPVLTGLMCLLAFQAVGWRTLVLTFATFLYIAVAGYWVQSMNTMALVCMAILLAMIAGFAFGVWAHRVPLVRKVLDPLLDFMQTVPTFAYLIPILLLFGFGPIVGLIASAIYAAPPMVRNTLLGLQRVPSETREAGLICGCSPAQQFWWVEVPAAMPQMKLGMNQTTMAAFSMVIISAIIGGFNDIGWEVLSNIRRADFGGSILSGIVIALLAMTLDRVTIGFVRQGEIDARHRLGRTRLAVVATGVVALGWLLSAVVPLEQQAGLPTVADRINGALSYVTSSYAGFLSQFETTLLYFLVLPVKIGLERVVTPFTWGFALTGPIVFLYWAVLAAAAAAIARYVSVSAAAAAFILGSFLFVGTTGMPWLAFVLVVTFYAWRTGGYPTALFTLASLLFILLAGQWLPAMISVYLCATAVAVSVSIGILLGAWGAASKGVSAVLRQVNDTLQTIPQFVFLIPVLMLFGVGDFTGLLAIILYAIVPTIRYTEHGLRAVPHGLIEAGVSMGCTRSQIFWRVKLPYAIPELLLGINQTILFAMAMLVIAALVGTEGLGQQIYVGLGKNDPGLGIVAGLSLAFLGMIADRILRSAARSRKAALGLD